MKCFKKTLASVIAIAVVFLIAVFIVSALQAVPAVQEPLVDDEILDAELTKRGYPQYMLSILLPEEKQALLDEDAYYDGSTLDDLNVPDIPFTWPLDNAQAPILAQEDTNASPHTIQKSDISLLIDTQKLGENIVVTFYYKWHRLPLARFEDVLVLGWDEDIFYMLDNSFQKLDCYKTVFKDTRQIHSQDTGFSLSGSSSVQWGADLKGYTVWTNDISGAGRLVLVPHVKGQPCKIEALYMHLQTPSEACIGYNSIEKAFVYTRLPSFYSSTQTSITVTS